MNEQNMSTMGAAYVGTLWDHPLYAEVGTIGDSIKGRRVIRVKNHKEAEKALTGLDVGGVCVVMTQEDLAEMRFLLAMEYGTQTIELGSGT